MNGKKSLDKFKVVSLDTNIFIYQFQDNPEFQPITGLIFSFLEANRLKACTSILTLSEILAFDEKSSDLKGYEEAFYSTPNLTILDIDYTIAKEAARIKRKTQFALSDSLQLATALINNSEVFITNDFRLEKFKEIPIFLLTSV